MHSLGLCKAMTHPCLQSWSLCEWTDISSVLRIVMMQCSLSLRLSWSLCWVNCYSQFRYVTNTIIATVWEPKKPTTGHEESQVNNHILKEGRSSSKSSSSSSRRSSSSSSSSICSSSSSSSSASNSNTTSSSNSKVDRAPIGPLQHSKSSLNLTNQRLFM